MSKNFQRDSNPRPGDEDPNENESIYESDCEEIRRKRIDRKEAMKRIDAAIGLMKLKRYFNK